MELLPAAPLVVTFERSGMRPNVARVEVHPRHVRLYHAFSIEAAQPLILDYMLSPNFTAMTPASDAVTCNDKWTEWLQFQLVDE